MSLDLSKRLRFFVCVLSLSALLLSVFEAPTSVAAASWPNSMASTGDSITRAFETGWFPFTDAPANSWSTGTNTTVNSQYLRILASNPNIKGKNYNDAVTGAKMSGLSSQITNVVSQKVDYVTILMGANDVCTSSEATMTSTTDFNTQFTSAMKSLVASLPNVRVFVGSIPNIYNLWSIFHNNSTAVATWNLYGICQSMLANATSTSSTDVARRSRVQQHNVDLNSQLQQVCALYVQCRFDNNAIYNTIFTTGNVSTIDYFHPSISGQTKLANVTYAATFNFGL